jgi:excisionase family DNA binding protein
MTSTISDLGRMLKISEVAAFFGSHENSIRTWIAEGKFPAVTVNRTVRVPESGLLAFVAKGGERQ